MAQTPEKTAALESADKNVAWMKDVYSTKEYWSEELQYGYRWSKDAPIKDYRHSAKTFEQLVKPHCPAVVNHALEIGPGGGRWTTELIRLAKSVAVVDISESVLDVCRERFKYYHSFQTHLSSGADLSFAEPSSVDLIFSWGVLVHVAAELVEGYVSQFAKILSEKGVAIVQHGALGTNARLDRSNVDTARFTAMAQRHGLTVRAQIFTSEGFYPEYFEGKQRVYLDCLSVLERTQTK